MNTRIESVGFSAASETYHHYEMPHCVVTLKSEDEKLFLLSVYLLKDINTHVYFQFNASMFVSCSSNLLKLYHLYFIPTSM